MKQASDPVMQNVSSMSLIAMRAPKTQKEKARSQGRERKQARAAFR